MLRNMEYIYAVYQEGSFSKAAQRLYVTQPCLSALIKKTEQAVGCEIFNRRVKPVRLTDFGERYIEMVEQVRRMEIELTDYASDINSLNTGHVSIGTNSSYAFAIIPKLIAAFNHQHPGIQVSLMEAGISLLKEGLSRGTYDLILDHIPMDEKEYERIPLFTERLLLAVPIQFRSRLPASVPDMTYADISCGRHYQDALSGLGAEEAINVPLVALRHGNDTRNRLDQFFQEKDLTPDYLLEVDQLSTAYQIASSNYGCTLVSDVLIRSLPPYPNLVYYNLNSAIRDRQALFFRKKSSYRTNAVQEFLQTALRIYAPAKL